MGIKVSDLRADVRTCTAVLGDEEAKVTYRPSGYTPDLEERIRANEGSPLQAISLVEFIVATVEAWEIYDDEVAEAAGQPVPLTRAAISAQPAQLLMAVVQGIAKDVQPSPEASPPSVAG